MDDNIAVATILRTLIVCGTIIWCLNVVVDKIQFYEHGYKAGKSWHIKAMKKINFDKWCAAMEERND